MKNKDYNSKIITDSALLMQMMSLEMKKVYFTSDDDTQNFEIHWKKEVIKGIFFEVMAEVIVKLEITEPWGFIEDEGYQRPDPGDYVLKLEFGDIHLYFDNMPICNERQIENIVIPQLEQKVATW
tara:strand:- start:943 stop:1317 length:375 start_codon:yes stop_codon:yes gene_type:complete